MVSTDAAARGIDIPNVTHVIQADFAASAVDFLHRVGHLHGLSAELPCTGKHVFQSVWCHVCIKVVSVAGKAIAQSKLHPITARKQRKETCVCECPSPLLWYLTLASPVYSLLINKTSDDCTQHLIKHASSLSEGS